MQALNMQRSQRGEAMAYDDADFFALAEQNKITEPDLMAALAAARGEKAEADHAE